ncbi:transcriptional regulator, LuxR family [Campylobacter pinnipediorum subsp. caledonicus]|uniref:helix-turn-helix transcriptional regulator n=1 Tax=Campylobacter pinnipediorum TaxID=1965231 RepID=UPI000994E7F2|nr:response regulator transcription factor [Campylobacter pinnipediorum]AQW86558.1 transcriptional regulator, LuxR family [Campylobacter pinnipediorum subsp. caledonicus]
MKVVLFTKSNSLYNLWMSYNISQDTVILTNINEFAKQIKLNKDAIFCIDLDSLDNSNDFIKNIIENNQDIKIIALSNEPKFNKGKTLLSYGIKGYANSHMREVHFVDAVETISDKKVWLYPEFIQQMIGEIVDNINDVHTVNTHLLKELTDREIQIAEFVQQGLSNKEISEKTDITLRTVKAHVTSIYNKMGVKDRIGLVLLMKKND